MVCPRCQSARIQRDYDDMPAIIRAVGLHKLLCNNCGLVFKGFDPLGKLHRAPSVQEERNRRRAPRYRVHLPASISLIEEGNEAGKATYTEPSRGHCETISQFGMSLSCVGTRIPEQELSRIGRLLFVRVALPEGQIEAVVSIVMYTRTGESAKKGWLLGVSLKQISDSDTERLTAYLARRAVSEPPVIFE